MKTERNIKNKLRQVKFRHIKRILKSNFKQTPFNCSHNMELDLEDKEVVLHVCGVQPAVVCDPEVRGCMEMARNCEFFEPLYDKDELKEKFYRFLEEADYSQISAEFPDIAMLLWVLDLEEDRDNNLTLSSLLQESYREEESETIKETDEEELESCGEEGPEESLAPIVEEESSREGLWSVIKTSFGFTNV